MIHSILSFLVKHKHFINCLAGFIIGFGLTCQLRVILFVTDKSCYNQFDSNVTPSDEKYSSLINNLEYAWLSNNVTASSNLLFVGIMTAQKFLDSRSLSIHQTWARELPGNYAFFSSSSSR